MSDFLMWAGGIIISGVFALIGWIFKMVFSAISKVEKDHVSLNNSLNQHKLHAAETFATKQDVRDGFDRVMIKLDKIDDKLDSKVDK